MMRNEDKQRHGSDSIGANGKNASSGGVGGKLGRAPSYEDQFSESDSEDDIEEEVQEKRQENGKKKKVERVETFIHLLKHSTILLLIRNAC